MIGKCILILKIKLKTFGMSVSYEGEIEFPQMCYLTRDQIDLDEEEYSIKYIQNSKRDGYVNGQIIITNTSDQRIEDWKLDFETESTVEKIDNIWNAKLLGLDEGIEGATYCQVDNATYNQNIEPGKSVEFGFIAKSDKDIKIVASTLYHMVDADYEDEDEEEKETIDLDNPYWAPKYDLDDFETEEEYEEYCRSIGYCPSA